MAKVLRLGELLQVARSTNNPKLNQAYDALMETVGHIGDMVASHFGIEHDEPDENDDDIMIGFYPKTADQPCPPVLHELDDGGDWEVKT